MTTAHQPGPRALEMTFARWKLLCCSPEEMVQELKAERRWMGRRSGAQGSLRVGRRSGAQGLLRVGMSWISPAVCSPHICANDRLWHGRSS